MLEGVKGRAGVGCRNNGNQQKKGKRRNWGRRAGEGGKTHEKTTNLERWEMVPKKKWKMGTSA